MSLGFLIPILVGTLLSVSCLEAKVPAEAVLSAPPEIESLTLAKAQLRALERNADLLVAQEQIQVALGQLHSAGELPNPTLNLSVARINPGVAGNHTAKGNGLDDRSYDSIMSVTQLFEVGKRGPRRNSARAGYRSAEAQRDDVRRLLIKTVTTAYVLALEAKEESKILGHSASSLRREADLADRRMVGGDIAASDKAQIEITAAQRELDAATAQQAASAAIVALEILLGVSAPNGQTPLGDSLSDLSLHFSPADVVPEKTRADIAAAEAALAKAEADLLVQRRQATPDVTLSAQFEHNPPDLPNTVGLAVGLPLPLWNRNGGGVRAARAARNQANTELDKVRAQAAADLVLARGAYTEARTRADRYHAELVNKSAEVVGAVRYSYEHGGATLIELLTAERSDNDIRLAAARADADAASGAAALAAALDRNDSTSLVQSHR